MPEEQPVIRIDFAMGESAVNQPCLMSVQAKYVLASCRSHRADLANEV